MDVGAWHKVLVLQTSFLGDAFLTLPLLAEIKTRFSAGTITVLCNPLAGRALQGCTHIDHILIDDKKGADRGILGLRRQAKRLKSMGFTIALTPHKSLRSALMLYFAGIPFRVGFRQSKGWFLFHGKAQRNAGQHDVERNLSLLRPFGIELQECRRSVLMPLSPSADEKIIQKLCSLGVNAEKLLVGINPGSVWATKRWSAEGFGRLIELIKRKHDCEVLLFGSQQDMPIVSRIHALCQGAAVILAGKIAIEDLAAAIGRCRLFVSNDSGPMHIAVARRVPTVGIFCATTPALGFYPYSANAIVVEKELPCRPCSSHGGRRCPLGTEDCIRLITPEHVFGAVERLLGRREAEGNEATNGFMPEFIRI